MAQQQSKHTKWSQGISKRWLAFGIKDGSPKRHSGKQALFFIGILFYFQFTIFHNLIIVFFLFFLIDLRGIRCLSSVLVFSSRKKLCECENVHINAHLYMNMITAKYFHSINQNTQHIYLLALGISDIDWVPRLVYFAQSRATATM